jgi:phenylpropionate dioxygenase-like ring-hydroxylating dioxygenase large terminal subunit
MLVEAPRVLLPPEAYWSEEWFDREQRLLFGDTWHLAASAAELTTPGDVVTVDAGRDPLIIVCGPDRKLRAFHNLCPHRGIKLVDGTGSRGPTITCPYHSWAFTLSGELCRVPQREAQFGDIDTESLSLRPAQVGEWEGMVFAHPEPDGEPLADWLGDLPAHIGSFRPGQLVELLRYQFDARCNWKLFVENHVDVYHLWYLHARTLADYDHRLFEWRQLGPNWVSYEPIRDGIVRHRPHVGSRQLAHLDERDRVGIGAHAAFPNTLMASEAEFFVTYVARPISPDQTVIDLRIRAEPDSDPKALFAGVEAFIAEDIAACEGVQASVRSSRFSVGPLAREHERPIEHFHRNLLQRLGQL